mmetsp:Transcript_67848/g.189415  ORF Transcript_67848/g.189415 Transcript_67848/m.189415 type:complete len:293 (+) Transcript_67848:1119-1997(+)
MAAMCIGMLPAVDDLFSVSSALELHMSAPRPNKAWMAPMAPVSAATLNGVRPSQSRASRNSPLVRSLISNKASTRLRSAAKCNGTRSLLFLRPRSSNSVSMSMGMRPAAAAANTDACSAALAETRRTWLFSVSHPCPLSSTNCRIRVLSEGFVAWHSLTSILLSFSSTCRQAASSVSSGRAKSKGLSNKKARCASNTHQTRSNGSACASITTSTRFAPSSPFANGQSKRFPPISSAMFAFWSMPREQTHTTESGSKHAAKVFVKSANGSFQQWLMKTSAAHVRPRLVFECNF